MLQLIGPEDDGFAIFATPSSLGNYSVLVYPQLSGLDGEVEVSKARLSAFLKRYGANIKVETITGTADLFISAVTESEVHQLTGRPSLLVRPACNRAKPILWREENGNF